MQIITRSNKINVPCIKTIRTKMLLLCICNMDSNRNVLTRHCNVAVYSQSIINYRSSISKKYIHSRGYERPSATRLITTNTCAFINAIKTTCHSVVSNTPEMRNVHAIHIFDERITYIGCC